MCKAKNQGVRFLVYAGQVTNMASDFRFMLTRLEVLTHKPFDKHTVGQWGVDGGVLTLMSRL